MNFDAQPDIYKKQKRSNNHIDYYFPFNLISEWRTYLSNKINEFSNVQEQYLMKHLIYQLH
jgi:hypothetical protein